MFPKWFHQLSAEARHFLPIVWPKTTVVRSPNGQVRRLGLVRVLELAEEALNLDGQTYLTDNQVVFLFL